MVDKKVLNASVIGEAEKFIEQWDTNEIELKPEAMNWTHERKTGRFNKQKSNLADYISNVVAAYKKIRTDALFAMESNEDSKRWITPHVLARLKAAAEEVIDAKTIVEGKRGFQAGEAIYKKLQTLQEQLQQEQTARRSAEDKAKTAEERVTKAEKDAATAHEDAILANDSFNRLTSKIRREMKGMGERFIQDALSETPEAITSETEEVDRPDE